MNYGNLPPWVSVNQAAEIIQMTPRFLLGKLAAGEISEKCAKKFGRHWRFNKEVLLEQGLVFVERD